MKLEHYLGMTSDHTHTWVISLEEGEEFVHLGDIVWSGYDTFTGYTVLDVHEMFCDMAFEEGLSECLDKNDMEEVKEKISDYW